MSYTITVKNHRRIIISPCLSTDNKLPVHGIHAVVGIEDKPFNDIDASWLIVNPQTNSVDEVYDKLTDIFLDRRWDFRRVDLRK